MGLDSYLENVFKRIRKNQNTNETLIIIILKEELLQIVRFHIDTGEEELIKEIPLDQSDFIVDQTERLIYFFKDKEILIEKI